MALGDCEKCWDTPCHCGWDGYVVLEPGRDYLELLRKLPRERFDEIRKQLTNQLRTALINGTAEIVK